MTDNRPGIKVPQEGFDATFEDLPPGSSQTGTPLRIDKIVQSPNQTVSIPLGKSNDTPQA